MSLHDMIHQDLWQVDPFDDIGSKFIERLTLDDGDIHASDVSSFQKLGDCRTM